MIALHVLGIVAIIVVVASVAHVASAKLHGDTFRASLDDVVAVLTLRDQRAARRER